jgi:hypothetical protein
VEITESARTLVEGDNEKRVQRRSDLTAIRRDIELVEEAIRYVSWELSKAGFNPDQPRWPKDSGEISRRWSGGASSPPQAPADEPFAEVLGNRPEIPADEPLTAKARNAFLKAAARWLARAALEATLGGPIGEYLVALEAAYWLYKYLPYVLAYLDSPKTWEELRQNALYPQRVIRYSSRRRADFGRTRWFFERANRFSGKSNSRPNIKALADQRVVLLPK